MDKINNILQLVLVKEINPEAIEVENQLWETPVGSPTSEIDLGIRKPYLGVREDGYSVGVLFNGVIWNYIRSNDGQHLTGLMDDFFGMLADDEGNQLTAKDYSDLIYQLYDHGALNNAAAINGIIIDQKNATEGVDDESKVGS